MDAQSESERQADGARALWYGALLAGAAVGGLLGLGVLLVATRRGDGLP